MLNTALTSSKACILAACSRLTLRRTLSSSRCSYISTMLTLCSTCATKSQLQTKAARSCTGGPKPDPEVVDLLLQPRQHRVGLGHWGLWVSGILMHPIGSLHVECLAGVRPAHKKIVNLQWSAFPQASERARERARQQASQRASISHEWASKSVLGLISCCCLHRQPALMAGGMFALKPKAGPASWQNLFSKKRLLELS